MAKKSPIQLTTQRQAKPPIKRATVRKSAKSSYIKVSIELDLKRRAVAVLDEIGLSTSNAVTIFFRKVVAQKGLPDGLKIPNRESIKALRELEKGGGESFRGTPEELFAHILGKKYR